MKHKALFKKTYFKHSIFLLFLSLISSWCLSQAIGLQSGSVYMIESSLNGKVIGVENSSLNDNAKLQIWTNTNSNAQKWIVNQEADNTFTITNVASGKVIKPSGSNICQSTPAGTSIEKWLISKVPDTENAYTIKVSLSDTYSICAKEADYDGAYVQIDQLSDIETEKWNFILQENTEPDLSATIKKQAINDWISAYFDTRGDNEVFKGEGFWGNAEMMEIVDDAFETTGDIAYMSLFSTMYNEFIQKEGTDWSWNEYNDDITWMCLACIRAYFYTGNTTYFNSAKSNFDVMYNRALTQDDLLGNGLIWKQGTRTKNACINGPAMVACCYLAKATGDESYYTKAISLYEWSKNRLFNPDNGHVYDAFYVNDETGETETNYWASTYNQATYLGASIMLYQYTGDPQYLKQAHQIAKFTRDMFNNGVINTESGRDLDGFKGIYMRYIRRYIKEFNRVDYIPWMQLNAKVSYNNRNSQGLINTLWGSKTSETELPGAFSASTAVSLLTNCPIELTNKKDAYSLIKADHFDFLSSVFLREIADDSHYLQIRNNHWVGFTNVDFGYNGAIGVNLNVASGSNTGKIEIRMNNEDGPILGTADIPATGDFNTYTQVYCEVENIFGMQHIYLKYIGNGTTVNLKDFQFIESSTQQQNNGLKANYYNGQDFNSPVCETIDSAIDFDWGVASPLAGVDYDNFSVRWSGQIEPLYSGTYTFYINSDNGRRLWINNELIIDKWINDWGVEYSGSIDLTAGQKYDIKIEYFEESGGANIKMEWESMLQNRKIVPATQLFLPPVNPTDITTSFQEQKVNIYPNPTSESIYISSTEPMDSISISDMNGKVVHSANHINANQYQVNLSSFPNGIFLVQLNTNINKNHTIKVVKK
ncbi:glycoside hydrolase family 76 protein [Plebeiibacterium marinum]|uniref:PA14 domain-containing protein n=1 Tax=Plebeiibacterium marinum TaxID=2992111 RepID=A0AAE3SKY6_9BACT|nr:glycoside hydrolase family 76 protein [Plebeiobacterium marinum]MCW3806874.1 PA14 domain-containing protein [Plebeiobacterium marinum]